MIANLIQNLTIITCAVVWGGALIVAIAWFIARGLIHLATRHLDGEPVPYWPADSMIEALIPIVMCPICRDDPRPGPCSCGRACGHPACVFAHVELTGLSEADERYMSGAGEMP
jgi:hypothetical protein